MFRLATPQTIPRAKQQEGQLTPLGVPFKGINAQATFSDMGTEYAITLRNVLVQQYGMQTRGGYTEWAKGIPGGSLLTVKTVMHYYPAADGPALLTASRSFAGRRSLSRPYGSPTPRATLSPSVGNLFAAKGGFVYDVTAGGAGPFVAEVGVSATSDFWTWKNFQNAAGAYLVMCNDDGGYAIFDGATWTMPVFGGGAGQISGVHPELLVYVTVFKKRLWFIEFDSMNAWYLPTENITGAATKFAYGTQMPHGGYLVALEVWTVDGGSGIDDMLVAVGSQGDVVVYKGTDPSDATDFNLVGTWYVGPLPNGRRCVEADGYDVNILSQLGISKVSELLKTTALPLASQVKVNALISPLVAGLMQLYSSLAGWQIKTLARDSLLLIGLPYAASATDGEFIAQMLTTDGWSILDSVPYASFATVGNVTYAGTTDGRVVRAFDGSLDNVLIDETDGDLIQCRVVPGYSPLGSPGRSHTVTMFRPSFTTAVVPDVQFIVLFDFAPPLPLLIPTLPTSVLPGWDVAIWDVDIWGVGLQSLRKWFGASGEGFAVSVQLEYSTIGGTLLTAMDLFALTGGIL